MKTISLFVLLHSTFIAFAQTTPAAGSLVPTDWQGLLEKGGMIGLLIWMMIYFQRKSEAGNKRTEEFADKAIRLLERVSDTTRQLDGVTAAYQESLVEVRELKTEIRNVRLDNDKTMALLLSKLNTPKQ